MDKKEKLIADYTSAIHFLNNRKVQLEITLEKINKEIKIKQKKLDIINEVNKGVNNEIL